MVLCTPGKHSPVEATDAQPAIVAMQSSLAKESHHHAVAAMPSLAGDEHGLTFSDTLNAAS